MQFILDRCKRPDEKIRIGVDFVNDLLEGTSITSHAIIVLDTDGVDVTSDIKVSDSTDTSKVYCVVQGGEDGKRYRVYFKATCNDGMIYEHSIEFLCALNS